MRPRSLRYLWVGLFVAVSCGSAPPAKKPASFSISCNFAGLTRIEVNGGKLKYTWHTLRTDLPYSLGSIDGYDRFEIDVWLTEEEQRQFRDWIAKHKLFGFKRTYSSDPKAPGRAKAFQGVLSVSVGKKKHLIRWDGSTKGPKALGKAVEALRDLAEKVRKARSR